MQTQDTQLVVFFSFPFFFHDNAVYFLTKISIAAYYVPPYVLQLLGNSRCFMSLWSLALGLIYTPDLPVSCTIFIVSDKTTDWWHIAISILYPVENCLLITTP